MSRADSPAAPTLARLSFWVPAVRLSEFETAYEARLAPVLKRHGLAESPERGRTAGEGVFSRLFAVGGPAAVLAAENALQKDPAWQEEVRNLSTAFGSAGAELRYHLGIYRAPAGSGRVREAGPGFRQGVWQSFNVHDGLPSATIFDILQDREGHLWFGMYGGICRYDGKDFKTFTTQDGLAHNAVLSLLEDREGHLWLGTWGGEVSRYDGLVFQSLSRKDGLAHEAVDWILQDHKGDIWIATEGSVTRYRPSRTPPAIRLKDVIADRCYGLVQEIHLPVSQKLVIFEFQGRSFTTRSDGMAYVYRLLGRDEGWKPTYSRRVEYQDLPLGEYTFQVRAVDRDLNYSEPASVRLKVVPDPRDRIIDALEQRVRERTRELEEKNRALEQANVQIQEANQHKSQFLSRMSHDLRTPMNAIIGYTRILLRKLQGDIDERQYRNLENIQLSADHLLSLINDILDLSRIEAGRIDLKPEPVDLWRISL